MDDGLTKSRRNLIAVSVFLTLFSVASVSVAKVSLLGTELLIGNPKIVGASLWVLWAYLLLRYVQFLGAEEDLGIRKAFLSKMDRLLRGYIGQQVQLREPRWPPNLAEVGYTKLTRSRLSWHHHAAKYEPGQGKHVDLSRVYISRARVLSAMLYSFFYVAVMTPRATEHVLPLLLAIAAPVVSLTF